MFLCLWDPLQHLRSVQSAWPPHGRHTCFIFLPSLPLLYVDV